MPGPCLVITAVGPDRPGLVKEVSQRILAAAANLEDTRMAILGGEFALLLLVTGEAAALERVRAAAPEIEQSLGLKLVVKDTEKPSTAQQYLPYRLRVSGVDHPGIVHVVSEILSRHSVNVATLESRLHYAPLSGTPMFVLDAEVQVPSRVVTRELRKELDGVCEADNLDFVLEARA
ncbi:MAG TPA: ACT domain-containing protein [Polyangiaceae bacterium]